MATKITDPDPGLFKGGRYRDHSWIEEMWLDGDVWRLLPGEDTPKPADDTRGACMTLVRAIKLKAKQRGLSIHSTYRSEDGVNTWVIYIQAYTAEPDLVTRFEERMK